MVFTTPRPSRRAGLVSAALPESACRRALTMDHAGGRDQVVSDLARGWRYFEAPTPSWFYAAARARPGTIVDVGANTGFYALLGAAACPRNRVIAFEPCDDIADLLARNARSSRLRGRVEIVRSALGDHEGVENFYIPTTSHGLIQTSSSLEAEFTSDHSEVRRVQVRTLDAFMGARRRPDPPVTLVKIDVEGHETAVLDGARRVIAAHRPTLIVEVLDVAKTDRLGRFLVEHDYWAYLLDPTGRLVRTRTVVHHPTHWNHAFVPSDRVAEFERLTPA